MTGPSGDGDRGPTPPRPLLRFLELFNRGDYWESHEALEDAWREHDSGFYHGLILFASAFVHASRGTRHGIGAQLRKAEEALAPYPSPYLGLDVDRILRCARRGRELVEARAEAPEVGWLALLPVPELEADPGRIRGDEPELRESRPGSAG